MSSNSLSNYNIVGTLSKSENYTALAGTRKFESNSNNLLLINKYCKFNKKLFGDFISYYSTHQHSSDIKSFWASDSNLYIVFDYTPGENIKKRFSKSKNTLNLEKRSKLLSEILIKLYSLDGLPLPILLQISKLENICIDSQDEFHIFYSIQDFESYKNHSRKEFFANISDIISAIFQIELNKSNAELLQIIVDKCKNGLYESIPELIIDFKKTIPYYVKSNKLDFLKRVFAQHKKPIKTCATLAICAIASTFIYTMGISPMLESGKYFSNKPFEIASVRYNDNLQISNANTIDPSLLVGSSLPVSPVSDIIISSAAPIKFENYIVKYGNTPESIYESVYENSEFLTAFLSFNDMKIKDKLIPGSVLRLPDPTSLNDYLENK